MERRRQGGGGKGEREGREKREGGRDAVERRKVVREGGLKKGRERK